MTSYSEQLEGFSDIFTVAAPTLNAEVPTLVAFTGPSGSGKDAILQEMEAQGAPYSKVRSATSRQKRPGEPHDAYVWMDHDGTDTAEGVGGLAVKYGLIEYQEHSGACYGIPLSSIEEAYVVNPELPLLVKSDPGGVEMLRKNAADQLNIVCVGLMPQSYTQLWNRMEERNSKVQRLVDAGRYAVEARYVANYIVRNTEHEDPVKGIANTAEQIARLIRLM
jgi:guanylate kinase